MTHQSAVQSHRSDDLTPQHFQRCGRFMCSNNQWFFKTREGVDYGPYENKTACRYAYEEFLEMVASEIELEGVGIETEEIDVQLNIPRINGVQQETEWKMPNISFF